MLTKEQVRREGTVIPAYKGNVKYRVQFWAQPQELCESDILSRSYNSVSYGAYMYDNVEFIKVEAQGYRGMFPFLVPMTDLQRIGIVEPDKREFKKGDKVKIPTRKTAGSWSFHDFSREMEDYKSDYLLVQKIDSDTRTTVERFDGKHLIANYFATDDLELYTNPEFVLPEKWSIMGGKELRDSRFKEWYPAMKGSYEGFQEAYYDFDGVDVNNSFKDTPLYPVITVEQFKQYVLKQPKTEVQEPTISGNCVISTIGTPKQGKTSTMNKNVIGYELIEPYPGFEMPAKLTRVNAFDNTVWMFDSSVGSDGVKNPQKHPNFWKPIYAEDEIRIGTYKLEKVDEKGLNIGCVYLNNDILLFLNKIIGASDIQADLTIKGVKITKEMVEKAYKLLHS